MTASLAAATLAGAPLAAKQSSGGGAFGLLLPLLLIVAFYFLLIRPQRNRMKQAQQLQSQVQVGQEVMTTSGLYGRVVALAEDSVVLEVAPGVEMRYARGAVARVITPVEPDEYDVDETPAGAPGSTTVDLTDHDNPDDPERRTTS